MTDLNTIQPDDTVKLKGKLGRPLVYEEGYKQRMKDTKYMLTYYHNHKQLVECEICKKQTNRSHIREHQKSKKCLSKLCLQVLDKNVL